MSIYWSEQKLADLFPVNGIIGIVANGANEVALARHEGLSSVEVRADLLLDVGLDVEQVLAVVADARAQGLSVLFTLRHPSHGGKFPGTESARADINRRAITAGAQVIDAEWDSELATMLLDDGAPVLLSQHNFTGMLSELELDTVTRQMTARQPLGLKVVPTASNLGDAARMLAWVGEREPGAPHRIGFAMGPAGAASRILTIAYGAPITYASLGAAVAPGQVPMAELRDVYAAEKLNADTRVYGIVGTHSLTSFSPFLHSPAFQARDINSVYVPLQTDDFGDLLKHADALRIDGMSVTTPYKEDALQFAHDSDSRSRECGASNTLLFERNNAGVRLKALNTDFDGVTIPLRQHRDLAGARVAIIGNGGAARGAIQALKGERANITMFYRNKSRGQPVADALGISGAALETIGPEFDVYINATTLGTSPDDPSPVPASAFVRPDQVAFEMLYQNPNSQFMQDAQQAGVACVRGAEMLVAQGTQQFRLFTGIEPGLAEFQANFERGTELRS
jgi:3-dehydroquinate dehydratase / shikimate dehydrogenase